jgi:hypothetical protein
MRLVVLLVVTTACSAGVVAETPKTAVSAGTTTTSTTSTTSTTLPEEPIPTTVLRLIDPATLEPITATVVIPGSPWDEPAVLPDGRLLLFSGNNPEADRLWLSLVDLKSGNGNNEPEVEGTGEATGLYILDPDTLDIREQLHPGVFFYYMDSFEDWIISESDIQWPAFDS